MLRAEGLAIPTWILLPLAIAAVLAIFLTTPTGQRLASTLGLPLPSRKGPSKEDRDFLLRACGGERAEVARRLDAEREKFPDLGTTEIHRRAIRTYMNSR